MVSQYYILIFFFYGLAFFSMGLAITLEAGRSSETRLRHGLWALAAFGFIHAAHEWLEMFGLMRIFTLPTSEPLVWEGLRILLLAVSFLALAAFGTRLLATSERARRAGLVALLAMISLWGFGILLIRDRLGLSLDFWNAADVWTRYVLGIPSALIACAGLIAQQRAFRRAGLARFGRDALWAAVAFAWYGAVGQLFARASPIPPSDSINQQLFLELFGFPVQLLRAAAAGAAAIFVIRLLRSFEVETQNRIAALQAAQLQEAQRRESLRGELLLRVVAAQEAERQRIARELHDETGQALTAIGLGLRGVSTTIRGDRDKAAHNLRHLENLAAGSLTELQRIIADLRPSHLDDLGLPAALRWYAGEVGQRAPLHVSVEIAGEPRDMPMALKTALFRVAQEALTNVVKHAAAEHAAVRLDFGSDAVCLEVEDDGGGFDRSGLSLSDRPAWGLIGMEERAALLGGQFSVDSQPGRGTRVEVVIPYDQQAGGQHDNPPAAGG